MLKGTEKQIKYAEDIRARLIANTEKRIEGIEQRIAKAEAKLDDPGVNREIRLGRIDAMKANIVEIRKAIDDLNAIESAATIITLYKYAEDLV